MWTGTTDESSFEWISDGGRVEKWSVGVEKVVRASSELNPLASGDRDERWVVKERKNSCEAEDARDCHLSNVCNAESMERTMPSSNWAEFCCIMKIDFWRRFSLRT